MYLKSRAAKFLLASLLLSTSSIHALEPTKVFRVLADATTTISDRVTLDHPFTNGNPAVRLIVTPVYLSSYHNHAIGVAYDSATQKWTIYNEDGAPMPIDGSVGFNVRATRQNARAQTFLGVASALNSEFDWTTVSRPGLNFNPDALLLITHNFNPPHVPGVTLNKNTGVWFANPRWAWYNQDLSSAQVVAFNIANITDSPNAFLHQTRADNVSDAVTTINSAAANNNPNALIFVTHNYGAGVMHNHPVGVYYDGNNWQILNQDAATMELGLSFNVKVYSDAN